MITGVIREPLAVVFHTPRGTCSIDVHIIRTVGEPIAVMEKHLRDHLDGAGLGVERLEPAIELGILLAYDD